MTQFRFAQPRPVRRPSLTPMIDVVFLLLVFFMLAARFGSDTALTLTPPSASRDASPWEGPPRLVEMAGDTVLLNGVATTPESLIASLPDLMQSPEDPILLRASNAVALQELIDLIEHLHAEGFTNTLLVE